MTETADNAMSRLTPSGGVGAVALGAAFHQVAQGLAHLQEALQLQRQQADRKLLEALRRHEQEAERRLQEALRLQEQRAASALREAVGQMEAKLQEKDAAIRTLEQRLEETLQRAAVKGGGVVEEGALGLAGTQQGMAAMEERMEGFEEQGALWRLEGRMDELESSLHRAIQKFFPRVDGLLRQLEGTPPRKASSFPPITSTSSGATCGEAATEEGAAGGREDNPPPVESLAPTASSPAFPTPSSTAASALGASVSEAAGDQRERPDAGQGTQAEDERVQRQRTELQIRRVMERVKAARASPSPLRGDLLKAVINGGLQDVQRLLDAGADVNCIDKNGRTPLLLAFLNARFEDMIELLLQRGADVNAVNIVGTSAMRQAACMDYSGRCMVRLVAAGGDVNARSETGATPLHCAADMRNVAAVRVLLAAGARKDLKPWKGLLKNKTPFEVAGTPEIKDLLRP